ncbi:hypothetical protein Tco_0053762 [Tanacetum coccineum]
MLQEPEQGTITTTAATTLTTASTRLKAKGLVIHKEEQSTTLTGKDEANVSLTEEWNDIEAKIDSDYQLAQRLEA